jgi:hypothetical protein
LFVAIIGVVRHGSYSFKRMLQSLGTHTDWNGQMIAIDTVPATNTSLGTLIAGAGLDVNTDGLLIAAGTVVVNLTGDANVPLDLTPIVNGAPEILFNLPIAAGITTTLSITHPPDAGMLAEFTLQAQSGAGSALTFLETVRWSQGIAPQITAAEGRVDTFVLFTQDGGSSYYGYVAALNQ